MGLQEIRGDWKRLALVGDAVILLYLRNRYFQKGHDPQNIHEKTIVSAKNESLGKWAKQRGVFSCRGRENEGSIYSHASFFEALIGMIYLEQGLDAVEPELNVYSMYMEKQKEAMGLIS
jgi:23S rRNA maturation mini-RNase III